MASVVDPITLALCDVPFLKASLLDHFSVTHSLPALVVESRLQFFVNHLFFVIIWLCTS
jgi:hypothetical protein